MPTMIELEEITKTISASASKNVNIISGICTKHGMGDKLSVTVIATGFGNKRGEQLEAEKPAERGSENVFDYGSFENILHGSPAAATAKQDPSSIKVSSIPVKPSSIDEIDSVAAQKPDSPSPALAASAAAKLRGSSLSSQPSQVDSSQSRPNILSSAHVSAGEPVRRPVQGAIRPPVGYSKNKDDLTQPACWRNLNGLSRSINLADGK